MSSAIFLIIFKISKFSFENKCNNTKKKKKKPHIIHPNFDSYLSKQWLIKVIAQSWVQVTSLLIFMLYSVNRDSFSSLIFWFCDGDMVDEFNDLILF